MPERSSHSAYVLALQTFLEDVTVLFSDESNTALSSEGGLQKSNFFSCSYSSVSGF
jgi:hypothetical protein